MQANPQEHIGPTGDPEISLHRWQVSFASGLGWYAVGELVASQAADAVVRAVEVFGEASGYRAEQIPLDAAPLAHVQPSSPR
jgi:hypothetical protein